MTLFGPTAALDLDGTRLYAGDCLDVMPALVEPVDLIIADLPYATTRNGWDRMIDPKALWHCWRALAKPAAPIVLFASGVFAGRMIMSNEADYRYDLIWDKSAVTGFLNAKRQPLRSHEQILVFYRQAPYYAPQMVATGRRSHSRGRRLERTVNHYGAFGNTEVVDQDGLQYPRSILTFPRPKAGKHPTQKPVALIEWLVSTYSRPGDLVLDPVAGSATTLVAARNLGRRAIGIELHEPYVDIAVDRLRKGVPGDRW